MGWEKLGLPVRYRSRAWDEDFLFLASARNVIISQSTFGWLAAFLGRASKIACPVPEGSFWHRGMTSREQPHLLPDRDDREWIWCTGPGSCVKSEVAKF